MEVWERGMSCVSRLTWTASGCQGRVMLKVKRFRWGLAAGGAALALALTACGGGGDSGSVASGEVDPNGIFTYNGGEPERSLMPADSNEVLGGLEFSKHRLNINLTFHQP